MRYKLIMAGPNVTTMMDGRTKTTRGGTILMVVLAACSSARWRRSVRSESEWTRRACATLVPKRSVCIRVVTSDLMSSTPVRSNRLRKSFGAGFSGASLKVQR